MTKPSPGFDFIIGDCVSIVLEDGRVLFGAVSANATTGARTAIWDPETDTWVEAGTKFGTVTNTKKGNTNEESWCLLPNGNVLTVQISATTATQNSEMYVPARGRVGQRRHHPVDAAGRRDQRDDPQRDRRRHHADERQGVLRRRQWSHGGLHVRHHGQRQGHLDGRTRPPGRRRQRQRAGRPPDLARRRRGRPAERARTDHVRAGRPGGEVLLRPGHHLRLRPGHQHAVDALGPAVEPARTYLAVRAAWCCRTATSS